MPEREDEREGDDAQEEERLDADDDDREPPLHRPHHADEGLIRMLLRELLVIRIQPAQVVPAHGVSIPPRSKRSASIGNGAHRILKQQGWSK